MGALLLTVEKITYVANRCATIESLYPAGTTSQPVLDTLHDALIKLYAVILQLTALACRLLGHGAANRTGHAIFKSDKIAKYLEECRDLETQVEREAQNCERVRSKGVDESTQTEVKTMRRLLDDLNKPICRRDENVSSLMVRLGREELHQNLDWISGVLYGEHHDTVKDLRTFGTCQWLLQAREYLEWQKSSSSMILWLHGTRKYLSPLLGICVCSQLMIGSGEGQNLSYLKGHRRD